MAKKEITSSPSRVTVDGDTLEYAIRVEYDTDDQGKIVQGSMKHTIVKRGGLFTGLFGEEVLAVSTDGANTFKFVDKDGNFVKAGSEDAVLPEKFQISLNTSDKKNQAFRQSVKKAIKDIALKSPDPELDDPDRTDDISGDGEYTEIENSGDLDIENNDFFGPSASLGSDKGLPGPGAAPLKYPVAMNEKQDHIEFRMVEYSPRKFTKSDQAGSIGGLGGFQDRRDPYTAESKGTVILPIQNQAADLNKVNWIDNEMDPIKAFKADLFMKGVKNPGEAIGDIGVKAEDALKNQDGRSDAAKAVASLFMTGAVGMDKNAILSRTTGGIINPNLELLFDGPALRTFSFTFRMSARNKVEAETIKKIIFFFKKGMAAKRTKTGLFLQAPNTFTVAYRSKNELHPGMNMMKECALVSCSVNYVPDGTYASHPDGNLTAYEMKLDFNELEPIYFDDYDKTDDHPIGY